jgi:tyrosyl-tRNA synthetase
MSKVLTELETRGLIAQISDEVGLALHLSSRSRTIYCGFDPTADSLHIGNLVPLLTLKRFQSAGHRPILLVGGATGLIGDPGGKAEERRLNSPEVVAGWTHQIQDQASRFLDFDGDAAAVVVNNLDWTGDLDVISFLRDVGKHFSVNAMIQRDTVRSRLDREGAGISYTEFSYMILQAMDFLELAKQFQCSVQVGGSDQWGNIVSGVDLVRRALAREAFAITVPLVTKADGSKFGKSESGTVWLDPKKTSPYSFYQFWINSADVDVVHYLRCFTFLEVEAIDAAAAAVAEYPNKREGQKLLAGEVTRLVHGTEGLGAAERISAALFSGNIEALTAGDLEQLKLDGMGCTEVDDEVGLIAVLADAGLAPSRSAARKLVQSKGVSVNGESVDNVERTLSRSQAIHGRFNLIRRGKRHWHLVVHEARQND